MKTLFVTVDPAFPPISGADLRNWQNVEAAAELGPVVLASIGSPGPQVPPANVQFLHLPGTEPSAVWGADFDVAFSAETIKQFHAVCAQFQFDAIVLESLPLVNLAKFAKPHARALIIDLHNIESDLASSYTTSRLRPWPLRTLRSRRIRKLENAAAATADLVWVCSAEDRDRLIRNGADPKRIDVIINGIPRPGEIPAQPNNARRHWPPTLLFVGHLNYPPNVDAAHELIALMPALWARAGGARLILAGRNPHPDLSARALPGRIDVIANPASLTELFLNADLAVMPLRRGGGTRIKVLEAMAWGLPVVATAKAVEGLDLEDGVHVRIAETPAAFIDAICDLGADPARFEAQQRAAREHVLTNFGPQAVRATIRAALTRALTRSPREILGLPE